MDMFKIFKGCFVCRKKVDLKRYAKNIVYADYQYYYYHDNCCKQVLNNPEGYDLSTVDIAIEVADDIIRKKNKEAHLLKEKERLNALAKRTLLDWTSL